MSCRVSIIQKIKLFRFMLNNILLITFLSSAIFCGGDHEELFEGFCSLFNSQERLSHTMTADFDNIVLHDCLSALNRVYESINKSYELALRDSKSAEVLASVICDNLEKRLLDARAAEGAAFSKIVNELFFVKHNIDKDFLKNFIARLVFVWSENNYQSNAPLSMIYSQLDVFVPGYKKNKDICRFLLDLSRASVQKHVETISDEECLLLTAVCAKLLGRCEFLTGQEEAFLKKHANLVFVIILFSDQKSIPVFTNKKAVACNLSKISFNKNFDLIRCNTILRRCFCEIALLLYISIVAVAVGEALTKAGR